MVASSLLSLAGVALKKIGDYAVGYLNNVKGKTGEKETPNPKTLIEGEHPSKMYTPRGGREGRESKNPYSLRPAYGTYAALIPLILGAAWMAYLVVGSKAKPVEAQLSPATNSLVASLFIFIIVYSVFLAFFFWNRTRALKAKETKKIIKKPKKKR